MNIQELAEKHRDTLDALYLKRFASRGDEWLDADDDIKRYLRKHNLTGDQVSMIRNYVFQNKN